MATDAHSSPPSAATLCQWPAGRRGPGVHRAVLKSKNSLSGLTVQRTMIYQLALPTVNTNSQPQEQCQDSGGKDDLSLDNLKLDADGHPFYYKKGGDDRFCMVFKSYHFSFEK